MQRVLSLFVTAILATGIAVLISPAPANAADSIATRCKPGGLIVIGLRGSGESFDANYGAGPTVYPAYQEIKQSRGSRPTDLYTINYPAAGVDKAAAALWGDRTFFNGIEQGVTQLGVTMNEFAAAPQCAHTHVSIVGYSQGAMVAHRYLLRTGRATLDAKGVYGILLIADGDRHQNDKYDYQYGTGFGWGWHQGISQAFPAAAGNLNPRTPIAPGGKVKVTSVCNFLDLVCDYSPVGQAGGALHIFQYRNSAATKSGARSVNATTPTRPTGPITAQPTTGAPSGNCNGQGELCIVVRRNVVIKEDQSNIGGTTQIRDDLDIPSGKFSTASLAQLRVLGISVVDGDCSPNCLILVGTPTGQVGVYPLDLSFRTTAGGTVTERIFLQIVPQNAP